MRWESYNFASDFQDAILACLIRHPDDFYAFGEIIKLEYFSGAAACEAVQRVGAEFGACVIMPDRCNRETVDRRVPNMKSFQGAFEKAGIVDVAVGLSTDAEYKYDRIRYFVFLNRHGDAYKHYDGTVDPERMRLAVGKEINYKPGEDDEDEV